MASSLRVSLLLFESLRPHLKYQQEEYLKKMVTIIKDDQNPNNSYELKELLLENLVQFFHLPGMVTELYLNYDCDSHCSNLYEDVTKLLSKQAFPAGNILHSTHLISLDGLCTLIDSIEENCSKVETENGAKSEQLSSPYHLDSGVMVAKRSFSRSNSELCRKVSPRAPPRFSSNQPTIDEIINIKQRKKLFNAGSELFNQKDRCHKSLK